MRHDLVKLQHIALQAPHFPRSERPGTRDIQRHMQACDRYAKTRLRRALHKHGYNQADTFAFSSERSE